MKRFRIAVVIGLLVCAAPMISLFIAGGIASRYGCTLHEGFVNPCIVMGRDIGSALYNMGVMGWLMLFTLPIAAALIVAWIAVELLIWLRARRAGTN